jgi:hypothetical protein
LDNIIFGHFFEWVIGRMNYSIYKVSSDPDSEELKDLGFSHTLPKANKQRLEVFKKIKVEDLGTEHAQQLFPYPIYGDYYNQRVLPENIGNYQFESKKTEKHRTIEKILLDAKRNLALRDSWASVFYHSYLLELENVPNKQTSLYKLVHGLKEMGYEFANINEFMDEKLNIRAPKIIEIEFKQN